MSRLRRRWRPAAAADFWLMGATSGCAFLAYSPASNPGS